jgi:uncharacterized protein YlbG (UPF0298 family)
MARGRKRGNRVIRVSVPRKLYYVLLGVAGNNEQKLTRLVRAIIEERVENSTIAELQTLLESKRAREEQEEETQEEVI